MDDNQQPVVASKRASSIADRALVICSGQRVNLQVAERRVYFLSFRKMIDAHACCMKKKKERKRQKQRIPRLHAECLSPSLQSSQTLCFISLKRVALCTDGARISPGSAAGARQRISPLDLKHSCIR
jgi:hypothetical protein